MKILFLSHRLPVPPNKGEKIRAFHQLRYLARDHHVDLLALVDDPDDLDHLSLLDGVCQRCEVVPHGSKRRGVAACRALLTRAPITLTSFYSRELAAVARRWQQDHDYDAVLAFSSTMAQYVANGGRALRVMDFVDVDSAKWEQYGAEATWPMSWLYRREGRLVAAWEAQVARRFDVSTFISGPEAALFRERVPDATDVRVVGNGVGERFFAAAWEARPTTAGDRGNLAFLGTMDYRPNVDGVVWFAREILPRIQAEVPTVSFTILGGRPTAAVLRLARRSGVRVAGFVNDVLAALNAADVFIAPLRIARGVQNKVLEALAYGLPVVATPQALEGIDAQPRKHLLVAADPAQFAASVVSLLQRPEAARALGREARQHMVQHYQWHRVLEPLGELFSSPVKVDAA